MLRFDVIKAVFRRNFSSFFSGALGYLFIFVFVVFGAIFAFGPKFFAANQANLDQLSVNFPLLLLFIIPAISMSAWADEHKLGTDELLFTLPARDIEILLGKYFALLAVYTVALACSLSHVFFLNYLGSPDLKQLFATFVGYWFAGAALLSAGMLASSLTSSTTVAFVLGVVFCALPVFTRQIGAVVDARNGLLAAVKRGIAKPAETADGGSSAAAGSEEAAEAAVASVMESSAETAPESASVSFEALLEGYSLPEQLSDFTIGVIPLSGIVYFAAFTIFMLYLNHVVISHRHWSGRRKAGMEAHFGLRSAFLAATLLAVCALVAYVPLRADMTSEGLFSLAPATGKILDDLDKDSAITIQAFVSPEVPREYVETRKRLIGLLREYDQVGGSQVEVRMVDVRPFSEESEEAQHIGVEPVTVMTERDGRRTEENVYMGASVQGRSDEVVVPFFGKGLPIEYELTRSIQTVAQAERLTVGVLGTDANIMSGSSKWQIITELEKQYEVEEVSPASEIDPDAYDVLLAVMPSSLTEPEMKNFVDYVKLGRATLVFDDPCPLMFSSQFGMSMAPRLPKPRQDQGMGMFGGGQQQPEPKHANGQLTSLLDVLNIEWDNGECVFDTSNPHPSFAMLPEEYVFMTSSNGGTSFTDKDNPSSITSDLQEVVAIYSGSIVPGPGNSPEFQILMRTGPQSGLIPWDDYVNMGFSPFSMSQTAQIVRNPPRRIDKYGHIIAAHITDDTDGSELNCVFVADIDMIADLFFQEWNRGDLEIKFDNVTFVLNAVDALAGEESFIDLRKRRARQRTLERVEKEAEIFVKQRSDEEVAAENEADKALEAARKNFGSEREKIEADASIDDRTKQRLLEQMRRTEERRLEVLEANLELKKNERITLAKAQSQRQIRGIENRFSIVSAVFPGLAIIFFGLLMYGFRNAGENRRVSANRRR